MLLDELLSQGYVLNDRLLHSQIIPFVQRGLRARTLATYAYVSINLLIVGLLVFHAMTSNVAIDDALSSFGLGVFLTFILIPIHEVIHGLAYRMLGARDVKYRANFRRFVFYAMADKFVVSASQFKLVAIAPFIIITFVLVVMLTLVSAATGFSVLAILLFHTGACSGDFGLISYLETQDASMITFDDEGAGETYFMSRPMKKS